jgi:hypothetical protein
MEMGGKQGDMAVFFLCKRVRKGIFTQSHYFYRGFDKQNLHFRYYKNMTMPQTCIIMKVMKKERLERKEKDDNGRKPFFCHSLQNEIHQPLGADA